MTKKRQRLKEYINYKLNKYYTVIFTLIIWDFLSFFICLTLFQILTILFPTVLLPPMGLFHKPVNTKLWKPIVLSHYIQKLLCTQKKKAVLSLLYYWSMKCEYEFKPSRRCETWGSCYSQTGVRNRKSLTLVETFLSLDFHLPSTLKHWSICTLYQAATCDHFHH